MFVLVASSWSLNGLLETFVLETVSLFASPPSPGFCSLVLIVPFVLFPHAVPPEFPP
ncbi:hypothetical protein A2U01_0066980, partial [Trifolium medium]|nr:hypothetical protein [Trifolium medium]